MILALVVDHLSRPVKSITHLQFISSRHSVYTKDSVEGRGPGMWVRKVLEDFYTGGTQPSNPQGPLSSPGWLQD